MEGGAGKKMKNIFANQIQKRAPIKLHTLLHYLHKQACISNKKGE